MRYYFLVGWLVTCVALYAQDSKHGMAMQPAVREPFRTQTGGRVIYHLYITDTVVQYTGKKADAIAINGTIPAPTLRFTEGDTAVIYVHNEMHMETSIHWHGLLLPNEQDGVPYLTTAPIKGHTVHQYQFPVVQHGTYWYHSHTMLQEQSGMYGAFIIQPRDAAPAQELTLLLSDWTNENPHQVERALHNANDWYGIRKKSTQNYFEAVKDKYLGTKLENEWKRMLAMDVSDVYYNLFTINGKAVQEQPQYKAGDRVRLRIINGSSSTYFWLQYGGGQLTVVASDGQEVKPVAVDRLIVGVSETYDVLVTIPGDGSYEFSATAEDRTNRTAVWLGSGARHAAPVLPRLRYFEGMKMMNDMMHGNGNLHDMGMQMSLQKMDMNQVMYPEVVDSNRAIKTLNYGMLQSPDATTLPAGPVRELRFELTGNMNRYVWTVDHKTISETDKILIRKGENIRIVLRNNSMMRHPMHLHGHFFRLLNGKGAYAPLKTVLDIMPMETDTLEFHASEGYGDWYFHCHILYHMMSGMGRIFHYEGTPPNPQLPDARAAARKVYADDRRFYTAAQIGLESNGSDGEISLANTRYVVRSEWRIGLNDTKGYENETHIGRYIGHNQFLLPYMGFDWRYRRQEEPEKNLFGQISTKDQRAVFCLGVQYLLPMLVTADARIDTRGKLRMQLGREDVPLTSRLRFNAMWNTDKEYMTGLRYIVSRYFSVSSHYDSDMGWGGGITLTY